MGGAAQSPGALRARGFKSQCMCMCMRMDWPLFIRPPSLPSVHPPQELDVQNTWAQGLLPSGLARLTRLRTLRLDCNSFQGELDGAIFGPLKGLSVLSLTRVRLVCNGKD